MDSKYTQSALSIASRIRRIVVGSVFISIAMNATGPLGYLTLLPLFAIYPILTGLLGEDPIDGLLGNWQGGFEGHSIRPSTRLGLLILGAAAIGVMMLSPEHVGIRALLALAALYPLMAGLFGEDLVSVALGLGRKRQVTTRVSLRLLEMVHRPRKAAVVRHHWFDHGAGPKAA